MSDNFLNDLHEPISNLPEMGIVKEVNSMIERVNEGYEDELKAYILFSEMEKCFKAAKESILEKAINNFQGYDQKTVELIGKKVSIAQSGTYSYTHYPAYVLKKDEIKAIEENMKASLNASKKGSMIVDENGEIIPAAIYTPSKMSLKIG